MMLFGRKPLKFPFFDFHGPAGSEKSFNVYCVDMYLDQSEAKRDEIQYISEVLEIACTGENLVDSET